MTKATTPLTYATATGVRNTKVKNRVAHDWEDLVQALSEPTQLDTTATAYRKADKAKRDSIKLGLPYFVGGKVNGARKDENIEHRSLLTLDIEAKHSDETQPPPPQDVLQALKNKGASGWVYTTISHTDQSPRYRVVLPLLEPIKDVRGLEATTRRAADALGIADWCQPESWVLSQLMFLPAKLKGGKVWQDHHNGKAWRPSAPAAPADIPEGKVDPVLHALRRAGLYLDEAPGQKGKHFITCPFVDEHGVVNETQTVYYEAHHDGNPRPAVKCLDTSPDHDGKPHLTYRALVQWLRDQGHLSETEEDANTAEALEDAEDFWAQGDIGRMLDEEPEPLRFAIEKLAPLGKVSVIAGPGGVSKSALALRLLYAASTGTEFGPFTATEAVRCMYISYEDDEQTIHHRLHAMDRSDQEEVTRLLYDMGKVRTNLRIHAVGGKVTRWRLVDKAPHADTGEPTSRLHWLEDMLRRHRVRLLVLDPAAYLHTLEENSPGQMASFMQYLGALASSTGCAIILLHHMHKVAQWARLEEINQGSLRGASAIADNARSVAVLVSLPQKEAIDFGLPSTPDTVSRFAVFKHVKHNYSASLGMHLFERKGPLLVPRPDLAPLSPEKREVARAEEREHMRIAGLNAQAQKALAWLADNGGEPISQNRLESAAGLSKGRTKDALHHAEQQGWLKSHDGANRAVVWTITAEGERYASMLARERSKRVPR